MAKTCSMCEDPLTKVTVEIASKCKYTGGKHTHAAAGTSLFPVNLPSAPEFGLMNVARYNEPCRMGNSMTSTLIAVLHSVKKLGSYIHLIKGKDIDPFRVMRVCKAVAPSRVCLVLSITEGAGPHEPSHTLYSTATQEGKLVSEEKALSVLLSVQRASSSMVFYWSEASLGYSVVLNQSPGAMWTVYMPGESCEKDAYTKIRMVQADSRCVTRVLPCFYGGSGTTQMMVMGRGGTDEVSWRDLEVGMAALCEPVIDRTYCSSTPTGRCFCCQYMVNLHEEVHTGGRPVKEKASKLRLCDKFWQKTKTGDTRKYAGKGKGAVRTGVQKVPGRGGATQKP